MSKRRSGLGRGLDVLLTSSAPEMTESDQQTPAPAVDHRYLPIDQIRRGVYQPRTTINEEALQELADSIKAQGVIQPIVVRPVEQGFELVTGERRWRASQLAGLTEIPSIIREISDDAAAAMALIENIQREDLNAIETARGLHRLINEFGLTHQQTADAVGRSRTGVSNLLRLLELEEEVKQHVYEKQLEMGHARALLSLSKEQQITTARKVVNEGLSVRQTEKLVSQELNKPAAAAKKSQKSADPNIKRLEEDLAARLGAKVGISYNDDGKGKLVIQYNSLDELDGILNHIH